MIELNDEQRQRLESGKAVDVVDPQTTQCYVIVKKVIYDRVCRLVCDDSVWSDDELRNQLARSFKDNGWDEPAMDAYDRYDEAMPKR